MADAPPSPELISVLRDQVFDEIERLASRAASYARSTGEAAFRGDEAMMLVHMKQLRLCCIAMIKTYKDFMNGQGEDDRRDRQDQRPGDAEP